MAIALHYAGSIAAGAALGTGSVMAFKSHDDRRAAAAAAELDALAPGEYKQRSLDGDLPNAPTHIGLAVGAGAGALAVSGGMLYGTLAGSANVLEFIGDILGGSAKYVAMRPAGLAMAGGTAAIVAAVGAAALTAPD